MSKDGPATARRVTADWARAYEGFSVWRPLRLLRRIGPVVQGITLDRTTSGDAYFPTAHIHALTREFPVVSLTLGQRLLSPSGVQEAVAFASHADLYIEASARLAEQSRLSLGDAPGVEQIVKELHAFAVAQQERGYPPAVFEMEDSVLVAAAYGDSELLPRGLRLAADLAEEWKVSRLPLSFPGKADWLAGLEEKAGSPSVLNDTIESQIAVHKLGGIHQVQ
ncbi:hypothetical protein [Streptomyces sp. NPDC021020]|uniref:hypothetical protein n=1 Tax=Streptomyces sp. NPDC021020 TaxID=3365109 RepID=UPI0037B5F905